MTRARVITAPIAGLLWAVVSATTWAQVSAPDSISYQGYLEQAGVPYENPSATLTFRLFGLPSGGTAVWTETQTGVAVEDGIFSVILGKRSRIHPTQYSRHVHQQGH